MNLKMPALLVFPRVLIACFPCRSTLIQHLKEAQHNLMTVIVSIMDEAIPNRRASRDFRAKYPDDVLLDQISGELFIYLSTIAFLL